MYSKGKIFILLTSVVIVIYGLAGLFYGRVVAENDGYKDIKVFVDVLKRVNDDYVEKPDLQKAMDGAMKGLIEALDPYSSYLTKDKLDSIEKQKKTAKADIGVELSKRGGLVYVIAPIAGGPASRAGIRTDDYIDAIDDKAIAELSLVEVQSLLRGSENSEAKLTLIRSASSDPIEKKVRREIIKLPDVRTEMLAGNIGYLKIPHFKEGLSHTFVDKLKAVVKNQPRGILLDLRSTAGGEFNEALAVANAFLRNGVIVSIKNRDGNKVAYEAKSEKTLCDLPLVVLVNQSTAGPAEIVTGALLDHKRAQVVGEKTFGMGSRQTLVPMKNGAALIISTEKYITPLGKQIQDESVRASGIKPNIISPEESYKSDLLLKSYLDDSSGADEKYNKLMEKIEQQQLDKAIDILNQEEKTQKKAA